MTKLFHRSIHHIDVVAISTSFVRLMPNFRATSFFSVLNYSIVLFCFSTPFIAIDRVTSCARRRDAVLKKKEHNEKIISSAPQMIVIDHEISLACVSNITETIEQKNVYVVRSLFAN